MLVVEALFQHVHHGRECIWMALGQVTQLRDIIFNLVQMRAFACTPVWTDDVAVLLASHVIQLIELGGSNRMQLAQLQLFHLQRLELS